MQPFRILSGPFALTFVLTFAAATDCWGRPAFEDPAADTFGAPDVAHDIARIDTLVSSFGVTFLVDFYGSIAPASAFATNSVVGFVDIDIDQNPLTGTESNKNRLSPSGRVDLGIEFLIDLFSERFHAGQVEVVDTSTMQPVGMAPVAYAIQSLSIDVPRELFGGDTLLNYGLIVGDYLDMSDEAPNDGVAFTIPEPSWLISLLIGGFLQAFCGRIFRHVTHATATRR
jgi:hypothetical protein